MAEIMRKAVPTEYLGVRYRSKSEAQFVRALHLLETDILLEYEPELFRVDDWVPDFLYLNQFGNFGQKIDTAIIELKPAAPSETYLENLSERMQTALDEFPLPVVGYVFVGSFYKSSSFQRLILNDFAEDQCAYFEECGSFDFGSNTKKDVLGYRFDLKHGGNSGGRLDQNRARTS